MYIIDTPLSRAVCGYADNNTARFHMPGHKGRSGFFTPDIAQDVTELIFTGSATEPDGGVFDEVFAEAAHLYGSSATMYSAGGATLALQAAIFLASKRYSLFACFRSVHRSVINAMALLGIQPTWLRAGDSIPQNSAVIVTSPDYYGRMADIQTLSESIHTAGGLLIVDNAHGAHLKFHDGGRLHPLNQGADIAVDSLHKTLPALTGSALLHVSQRLPDITSDDCREAMRLFGSTSPSYLINISTEQCLRVMSENGESLHAVLLEKINKTKSALSVMGYDFLSTEPRDPFRIVFRMENAKEFDRHLISSGIICEFSDRNHIVLIPSVAADDSDFDRLISACRDFTPIPCRIPESREIYDLPTPEAVMTLREAVLARHAEMPISQSVGLICGEAATPYPPGVPVLMPGERVAPDAAGLLSEHGVESIITVYDS